MTRSARPRTAAASRLFALPNLLTERDGFLLSLLSDHLVLTTGQLGAVAFTGLRCAEARLSRLHHLDLVDRFRPHTPAGSAPYHYVLARTGAHVVAAQRGIDPAELGWRPGHALALARSGQLAHLVGVNGLFTALIHSGRTTAGCRLALWWSARRCAAEWGHLARPDGYAVWDEGGRRVPFFLEFDNGTERLARLAAKLSDYRALASAAGYATPLLFSFPAVRRETEARRALADANTAGALPIATTQRGLPGPPEGPVWLPLPAGSRPPPAATRIRLVALTTTGHT